jgi:hypothetical protein
MPAGGCCCGGGGGGGASCCCDRWSRAIVVDPQRDIAAPQNGDPCCPFSTLGQAFALINAMTPPVGETPVIEVLVLTGVLTENVVWPSKFIVHVKGQGSTALTAPAGDIIFWSPPAAVGAAIPLAILEGMVLITQETNQIALHVVSQTFGLDGTFLENGFVLRNVAVEPGGESAGGNIVHVTGIGRLLLEDNCNIGVSSDGSVSNARLRLEQVGELQVDATCQVEEISDSFDGTQPEPAIGRSAHLVHGSVPHGVILFVNPDFVATAESSIGPHAILGTSVKLNAAAATAGFPVQIELRGRCTAPVVLDYPDIDGGVGGTCSLEGGTFDGDVTVTQAANTLQLVVNARCAYAPAQLTAGDGVTIDIRGGDFAQANLAVAGTGDFDRSWWTILGVAVTAVPVAVPIVPPFPAGATYVVTPQLDIPNFPPGITLQTPAQFTAVGINPIVCDFVLTRN